MNRICVPVDADLGWVSEYKMFYRNGLMERLQYDLDVPCKRAVLSVLALCADQLERNNLQGRKNEKHDGKNKCTRRASLRRDVHHSETFV